MAEAARHRAEQSEALRASRSLAGQGSARQLDGTPADLLNPCHYPVEAICAECGQPIRVDRYYFSEWVHIARFSNPPA